MDDADIDLPPEIEVALAYARPTDRPVFRAMLELDRNLGRAVGLASEPIIGQIRLAWWRDALSSPDTERPRGNPLLDRIAVLFGSGAGDLVSMVDGWEAVLLAEGMEPEAIKTLSEGRAKAFLAVSRRVGADESDTAVGIAASNWSVADIAANCADEVRRNTLVVRALSERPETFRLSSAMRPLAVLHALAKRALKRGGAPLLADRGAALVALRCGLLGR